MGEEEKNNFSTLLWIHKTTRQIPQALSLDVQHLKYQKEIEARPSLRRLLEDHHNSERGTNEARAWERVSMAKQVRTPEFLSMQERSCTPSGMEHHSGELLTFA